MLNISNKFSYGKTVFTLALTAFIFGCIGISFGTLGVIIVPFIAAFLGALFVFERKKIVSIIIPLALIIIELFVNLKFSFTFTTLAATLVALIMALCYEKKWDKRDSALINMVLLGFLICTVVYFAITKFTKSYDFDVAFNFFKATVMQYKDAMLQQFASLPQTEYTEIYSGILTPEYLNQLFDAYIACIPALVLMFGFIISGIAHKLFRNLLCKYAEDKKAANQWRFINTHLYAYFYAAVAIISVFSSGKSSIFSISVMNLYLLFMVIFAYTGYSFLHEFLEFKLHNRFLATLILLAAILLLSSLALQILSVVGTVVTILFAKISKNDKSFFSGDRSSD